MPDSRAKNYFNGGAYYVVLIHRSELIKLPPSYWPVDINSDVGWETTRLSEDLDSIVTIATFVHKTEIISFNYSAEAELYICPYASEFIVNKFREFCKSRGVIFGVLGADDF